MLEDAVLGAWGQVVTGLPRHRDSTDLARVFELAVATALSHQKPPVLLQQAKDLGNFHVARTSRQRPGSPAGGDIRGGEAKNR